MLLNSNNLLFFYSYLFIFFFIIRKKTHKFKDSCVYSGREQLIKERSKYQVLLTNQLDLTFPELKSFLNNRISATLLFILEKYTNTEHISLMRDYDSIRCISHGKFSYAKFAKLKELAKNSVGHHNENTDLLISTYVSIIKTFNDKIDPIEKQISTIIKELNPKMLTIPGLGEI